MKVTVDNLGTAAHGDTWLFRNDRIVIDPRTGEEHALLTLSCGGFMLLDPRRATARQVSAAEGLGVGWGIAQVSDGTIYQAGWNNMLSRWNWEGDTGRAIPLPAGCQRIFHLAAMPDSSIWFCNYATQELYRYDHATGRTRRIADQCPCIESSQDGDAYTIRDGCLVSIDPDTGKTIAVVRDTAGNTCANMPVRDSSGYLYLEESAFGRIAHTRLIGCRAEIVRPSEVRLAPIQVGTNEVDTEICGQETRAGLSPLVFSDGCRIVRIIDKMAVCADARGVETRVAMNYRDYPVKLWCVACGGGRVWAGSVIPIKLSEYDPARNCFVEHGNPTETKGEIYSMAFTKDKLYIASYVRAALTRYDPRRPWKLDRSPSANPAALGFMGRSDTEGAKRRRGATVDPKTLHRPRGRAVAPDGRVYFSACGSYGCNDSGICRITPETDDVECWRYPDTTMNAICYLASRKQLLVDDSRLGEDALRFSFIDPETGKRVEDAVAIADKGAIRSWLTDGDDLVYGVHDYRAAVFQYSLSEGRIIRTAPELPYGEHCYNCLVWGPDGRLWGLTERCVFAIEKDLSAHEAIVIYEDGATHGGYRFGMEYGPDGALYFANGADLMRLRVES